MKRLIAIMATALVASSLLTAAAEARGRGGGMGTGGFAPDAQLGGVASGVRFADDGIGYFGGVDGHVVGYRPGFGHHHYIGYGFYPNGGIYDNFYGSPDYCYDWYYSHPGQPLPLRCN